MASAVRASATGAVVGAGVDAGAGVEGAGAGVETGTVTSVLAAGLEAVFLATGIVFTLVVDFEGAIFNALVYSLSS